MSRLPLITKNGVPGYFSRGAKYPAFLGRENRRQKALPAAIVADS